MSRKTRTPRMSRWKGALVPALLPVLVLTATACGSDAEDEGGDAHGEAGGEAHGGGHGSGEHAAAGHEAGNVGHFASPDPGSVNTFWIEGPDGLIVIDAQRSLTDARAAVAAIGEDTDLPVAAVLLTHPHPDHVGGVGVFTEAFPEARVYSSQETREFMREDPLGFYELTRSLPGSDYAEELTLPEWLVTPGGQLDLAGVHLESAQFGPGESVTTTVFYEPDSGALFAGDLVGNEVTPALIEGETCGWLADLRHLEHEFHEATVLYPGHGEPGDPHELIEAQRHYLEEIRHLVLPTVRESSPGGAALTDAEREELVAELTEEYPDHRPVATLPDLHAVNVEAVAEELREAPAGQSCH